MSSHPVFSGVRVTRSLVLHVSFVDRCLSFCTFSFGHCVFCPSSIYKFWKSLNLVTLTILETVTELINWTVNEFINFRIYLILAFINKKWHSGNTFSRNYRRNSRILPGKIKIYLGLINTDWSNMPKSILSQNSISAYLTPIIYSIISSEIIDIPCSVFCQICKVMKYEETISK